MRVEAHVHIGRARKGLKDCISVRRLPDGKVFYVAALHIGNATLSVQPAGLRKFRQKGVKNVHAYVRGDLIDTRLSEPYPYIGALAEKGGYNPMKNDTFVDVNGDPLTKAWQVVLNGKQLYYIFSE